jgi:hypothetical protein
VRAEMGYYEIVVENHIDKKRARYFEDMDIQYLDGGKTLLSGKLADQAQLFSILNTIRDMNLILVSIKKDNNNMEV